MRNAEDIDVVPVPGNFLGETEAMQNNAKKRRHICTGISGLLKILMEKERKDRCSWAKLPGGKKLWGPVWGESIKPMCLSLCLCV